MLWVKRSMNELGVLQGRHYYVNQTTQKVTWKHPTVTNQRAKFGQAAVPACQNSIAITEPPCPAGQGEARSRLGRRGD